MNLNGKFSLMKGRKAREKLDRQTGIQAAEWDGPQGIARQTFRQAGIQQSKQAECYCMKQSGPKARQTHRSGRVMLILWKGYTLCSSFCTVASKHHTLGKHQEN